jgi:23S rRNA (cytidine2498-2'-O)-methyltransferase
LRFVEGDAFRYEPESPVDWMIADVAAFPIRTLDLIQRWLNRGWCRALIATVKFIGTSGYGVVEDYKAMLRVEADDFIIRKLAENKNEVTVMAWRGTTNGTGGPTTGLDAEA